MDDIDIRVEGQAGRITLQRPEALNALTYDMCLGIERALDRWRADDSVRLVLLDAAGEKAFCAGGDIAEMYRTGMAGDFAYGQKFWADEYRMNHKVFHYPKPVVSFLQGFTMGAVLAWAVMALTGLWARRRRLPCRNAGSVWCRMSEARLCWPWRGAVR